MKYRDWEIPLTGELNDPSVERQEQVRESAYMHNPLERSAEMGYTLVVNPIELA